MALTITIPGAVEATIGATAPAVLTIGVGTPGATGPQGPAGAPGVGVPVGGTAGQFLTKIDGTNYNTDWTTVNLSAYLTKAGNLSGLTSLSTARDNLNLGTSNTPVFAGVTVQGSGANVAQMTPTSLSLTHATYGSFTIQPSQGIVFPDASVQVTAYPGPIGATQWGSIGGVISAQTDLQGELDDKLALSGGAMTGSITNSTATYDTEMAGDLFGVQLSSDHTKGTTVQFNGLDTYDGASHMTVTPAGLTFPDATVQTTAYTGGGGGGTWGSITGTLSNQTDLQSALDAKYDVTNPAGFITFGDLTGYATESWVTGQGYITSGYLPNIQTDISFDTNIGTPQTQRLFLDGVCELTPGSGITQARFNFSSNSNPNSPVNGDMWVNHTYGLNVVWGGITNLMATQIWVNGNLNLKASLSGATFTGKVNLATLGVATPSINLGGQCDSAPASAANGDIWISNATAPKLTYKMGGVNYNLPVLNQFNTFTNQMVIDTTSATTAALRVTQRGAGNAIEVEDQTSPDATRFVVDQFGKVGVGVAPDATAAIKIDGNGISFNGLVFNPTATSAHTGGSDTLDLLVTINGTNYRLGLRPA
jgi:hypothetical protein